MKKLAMIALGAALTGCVNLYTRCPFTDAEIRDCYQGTRIAAAATIIGSFPSMMSDCPNECGFHWWNTFTIVGIGIPCFIDTVCESVIDTICLPVDWLLSSCRAPKKGID